MYGPDAFVRTEDHRHEDHEINCVVAELTLITERLANMGTNAQRPGHAGSYASSTDDQHGHLVALAEQELHRRKLRTRFLPAQFFGEASWSILLDLYVSEARKQPVATTSACIAADVPASTALRWLEILDQRSLIERYDNEHDRRVKFIRLTDEGRQAVEAILSSY